MGELGVDRGDGVVVLQRKEDGDFIEGEDLELEGYHDVE